MPDDEAIYAVTLTGNVRHIFLSLPGKPMPSDARALCGRSVDSPADKVPGADDFPVCRLCAQRAGNARPKPVRAEGGAGQC